MKEKGSTFSTLLSLCVNDELKFKSSKGECRNAVGAHGLHHLDFILVPYHFVFFQQVVQFGRDRGKEDRNIGEVISWKRPLMTLTENILGIFLPYNVKAGSLSPLFSVSEIILSMSNNFNFPSLPALQRITAFKKHSEPNAYILICVISITITYTFQ